LEEKMKFITVILVVLLSSFAYAKNGSKKSASEPSNKYGPIQVMHISFLKMLFAIGILGKIIKLSVL